MKYIIFYSVISFLFSCSQSRQISQISVESAELKIGQSYKQHLTIAYEIHPVGNNFGFPNYYDPYPKGFVIYDGHIDTNNYINSFYVTQYIDSEIFDSILALNINEIPYLERIEIDSIILGKNEFKQIKLSNKNLKINGKPFKYEYKILEVSVNSVFIGKKMINKPIFGVDLNAYEYYFESNIFIPTQMVLIKEK